jgi:hypothetical protein
MNRGVLALVLCSACSGGSHVVSLHDLHQPDGVVQAPSLTRDYYALPFPNDARREADGTIDLRGHPRPAGLLADYVDAIDRDITGFGTNAGIYFRFDGPLDPASLPADPNASLDVNGAAFVVELTEGAPAYGKPSPVRARFVATGYEVIGPNWLGLLPYPGVPLKERTTYAAILTDGLRSADGGPVARHPDFDAALAPGAESAADPWVAAAARAYAPLKAYLATRPGLAERVVNATVFTTVDTTGLMPKLRQAVYTTPAPVLADLVDAGPNQAGVNHLYEATYRSPNFQEGDPPYDRTGGAIRLDAQGLPIVQRTETLRILLSIPEGPMPAAGWPVVLYAHGTGGSYRSFINDGSARQAANITDANGATIARMAMVGIDQVLHGPRVPPDTAIELAFFNLVNIVAARANVKQGAADDFQLVRLVKGVDIAQAPGTNAPIKFDPAHIYFKGHSQGGLTGPLFLAAEPEVRAAVLSGAGGGLILSLLHKTEPVDITMLVGSLLRDPVDEFHPLLSLAQLFLEDSDPVNYGHLFFRAPPAGFEPKSIFQSLGLIDRFTPVPVIKALALSMGVQPIRPELDPIEGLDLAGLAWGNASA